MAVVTIESATIINTATKGYRFFILIFISLIHLGSYFAYDIIGAIAPTLVEELGGRGNVGVFYSSYSIGAIMALFIGGVLIDRLGIRISSIIFSLFICVGAFIVAASDKLWMFYLGRSIFGMGSEIVLVVQLAMVTRWFKGHELALAMGITITIGRLGTLISYNTGELITAYFGGFRFALIVAAVLCVVSLVANVIYVLFDKIGEQKFSLAVETSSDKIVLDDIKAFKPSYWYVSILCMAFYSVIGSFMALSPDFFVEKWGIRKVIEVEGGFVTQLLSSFKYMFHTAGGITSIIIFASMIFAPLAGHLVDKVGKRISLMMLGSIILIVSNLILGYTELYPVYSMILLGISFVLVPAAIWSSIPLLVPKDKIGTAFGITTMIQNIGLLVFPYLNGFLRDNTNTYTASQTMFALLGVLGVVFALLLLRTDRKEGVVLEVP